MKTMNGEFSAFHISLSEEVVGAVVISSEEGSHVTLTPSSEGFSKDIIKRISDAVRVAYTLNYVSFDMSDEVAALYYLTDACMFAPSFVITWDGLMYSDSEFNNGTHYYSSKYEMLLDASRMLNSGCDFMWGIDGAIELQQSGTYKVTKWTGEVNIATDVEDALYLTGFFDKNQEVTAVEKEYVAEGDNIIQLFDR